MCATSKIVSIFFVSVFIAQWRVGKSSESNATTEASALNEEEVDSALENRDFAESKERYRRLTPYTRYRVANDYVNSQVLSGAHRRQPQSYERETGLPRNPLTRKAQRPVPIARPIDSRRKANGRGTSKVHGGTLYGQEEKFVPSIRYDPKDIGIDTDYFTPVKYTTKLNDDKREYSATGSDDRYDRSQQRPLLYPEVMNSAQGNSHRDTEYYAKERRQPARASTNNLNVRKYLPEEREAPVVNLHQDYLLDYNYPSDDYEAVRYVNIEPPPPPPPRSQSKPTRILAQSIERQPPLRSSPIYLTRNPHANLQDIMKSLQLTNRLPEMLNKDNIDSSIETLVEILGILNNAKRNNQLVRTSHRNVENYNELKEIYTRPKVVTETRFEATPGPSIIHDETSYEPNANYEAVNNPKHENVVEYYRPLVQDIEEAKIERFKPTKRPQKFEENSGHAYEITGDLADDILERDRYALPITTETPISEFRLPDGASTHTRLVPPTTLEYGATRGKPNIDYPAHAAIPQTDFNCKEQRYKGFFGDPTTGCQVWHYCDLNGGKSSFLCPNGTIFSQVALTCDWWFNVKCESTPQLYVLNERLYKYILPVMPKFPEDFSGPEVDRYLELKFKEMEAKLKEKKLKKQQEKDNVKEKLQALDTEE